MAKVNKRLLPIKAHFLFFMAAMGPILPQLSVIGKEIGIAPEVMGYITSVLPIMYVVAKPLFGFVVDYFASMRKFIFMGLIAMMTLSYGAFMYLPAVDVAPSTFYGGSAVNLSLTDAQQCATEVNLTRYANCTLNGSGSFEVFSTNLSAVERCYVASDLPLNWTASVDARNASCRLALTAQERISSSGIYSSATFWLFVLFLCLGTIGYNVVNSISDAICFDMLGEAEESKYGAQRVWGTIGFGLAALIAGIAVDMWTSNTVKSFAPALLIMYIFSGLDLLSVSKLKLPQLSSSESIFKDVWQLITQPAIATFLVFATVAGIIDSFIIYFLFWHVEEVAAATGYMDQIKLIEGCVVAAECLAGEVPFFFYSGKIIKKLGYVHCMSMCFFFYALRLALISWIPNPWYLVGVELFFQGCTYALCYTCIVGYAATIAPPGTTATVQGLIAGMDDGLGFSIGSLIGGLCFKSFGGRRSFRYFSIAAILTCVAHIVIRPSSHLQQNKYSAPKEQDTVAASLPLEEKP